MRYLLALVLVAAVAAGCQQQQQKGAAAPAGTVKADNKPVEGPKALTDLPPAPPPKATPAATATPAPAPRTVTPAPTTKPVAAAAKPAPAGRTYLVKPHDSLMGIARTQLGDQKRWKEIVQVNPGLTPENLTAGQTIKLPAK